MANVMSFLKKTAAMVARWLGLSSVSFALYWVLWYLIDRRLSNEIGYSWDVVLFDFSYCAVYCAATMTICHLAYMSFLRHIEERWAYIVSSLLALLANIAMAVVFELVSDKLFGYMIDLEVLSEGIYIYSLIATLLSAFLITFRHYELYRKQVEAYKNAEIGRLKNQINPHFLFNNLATLDGLIEKDTEKAHDYLIKISHNYRYFLEHANDDTVKISEAIKFVRNYVELLSTSNKGHFLLSIEDGLDSCPQKILCLSLQLLIENAIKHNVHSAENPIEIIIERNGDSLSVRNTFRPNGVPMESTHMGQQNLQQRYRIRTGRDCQITRSDDWYKVTIPIIS